MDQGPRRWVPDNEATRCFLCARGFDVTTRKHHCRYCGRVVCANCSPSKCLVPLNDVVYPPREASLTLADFDPREVQRVCRECEHVLIPMQPELQQTMTHSSMPTHHDRSSIERYLNSPVTFDLKGEILKASNTLLNFTGDNAIEGADSIPKDLIAEAKGLAFVTFVKIGLFVTARMGTGLVIARTRDGGWSAPSAVASGGIGWGFQIGGELTDMVIVLNTLHAVESFAGRGQVSLGTELSLSVGPVGRTASTDVRAGDGGVTAAFSYAHSKGVFIGVSVEAGTLFTRKEANRDFYGSSATAHELLLGDYPRPKAAEPLYAALREVEAQGAALLRGRRRPPAAQVPPSPAASAGQYPSKLELGGNPAAGGAQGASMHFAPFQPGAEDHLRSFTVTADERKQMEDDYKLALAMQKGEAVAAHVDGRLSRQGSSEGAPLPPPTHTSSMLARIGSVLGDSGSSSSFSNGNGLKGSSWRVGARNRPDDAWEIERRARMEQARLMDSEGSITGAAGLGASGAMSAVGVAPSAGSELGEMRGSSAGAFAAGKEFGGVSGVTGVAQVDDEQEDDSSDDDEYRRDIAQFASRKKGM